MSKRVPDLHKHPWCKLKENKIQFLTIKKRKADVDNREKKVLLLPMWTLLFLIYLIRFITDIVLGGKEGGGSLKEHFDSLSCLKISNANNPNVCTHMCVHLPTFLTSRKCSILNKFVMVANMSYEKIEVWNSFLNNFWFICFGPVSPLS